MSYAIVLVFEGVSQADYWAVNSKLGLNRDGTGDWPAGMQAHVAGPTSNGGWVVIESWDAKASQEAFMGSRLGAALAAAGLPAPSQVIETDTINEHMA